MKNSIHIFNRYLQFLQIKLSNLLSVNHLLINNHKVLTIFHSFFRCLRTDSKYSNSSSTKDHRDSTILIQDRTEAVKVVVSLANQGLSVLLITKYASIILSLAILFWSVRSESEKCHIDLLNRDSGLPLDTNLGVGTKLIQRQTPIVLQLPLWIRKSAQRKSH